MSWADNPENEKKLLEKLRKQPLYEILTVGMSHEDQYYNIKRSIEKRKHGKRGDPSSNTNANSVSVSQSSPFIMAQGDELEVSNVPTPTMTIDAPEAPGTQLNSQHSRRLSLHSTINGKAIIEWIQEDPLLLIDIDNLPPSLLYRILREPNEYIGDDKAKMEEYQKRIERLQERCQQKINNMKMKHNQASKVQFVQQNQED